MLSLLGPFLAGPIGNVIHLSTYGFVAVGLVMLWGYGGMLSFFTILDHLGKPRSLIRYVTDRPGHDRRYAMNIQRAQDELGFTPQHDLQSGLRETIDWYLNNRDWVERIRSGAYRQYYEQQYGNRMQDDPAL